MQVKLTVDTGKLDLKIREAKGLVSKAMPQIYTEFVKNTPIKTGNAKSNTSYSGQKIKAKYQYASVLNDGRGYRDGQMRGSNQAPKGMVQPTKEFAVKLIKQMAQALRK